MCIWSVRVGLWRAPFFFLKKVFAARRYASSACPTDAGLVGLFYCRDLPQKHIKHEPVLPYEDVLWKGFDTGPFWNTVDMCVSLNGTLQPTTNLGQCPYTYVYHTRLVSMRTLLIWSLHCGAMIKWQFWVELPRVATAFSCLIYTEQKSQHYIQHKKIEKFSYISKQESRTRFTVNTSCTLHCMIKVM